MTAYDELYMMRALELAARGQYTARPNPQVGCVIVQNEKIVGEGFHDHAGGDHAEIMALSHAQAHAKGATVYVNLEPCAHIGKTPPCVDALIAARVQRVVYAGSDPNPLVSGKGKQALEQAGIQIECGVLSQLAADLNKGFFKRMREKRPHIILKTAMSLDGYCALASGESQWITGEKSRAYVQQLRAESGAILTGIHTVLRDDPQLTVRDPLFLNRPHFKQPLRVILDSQLQMPLDATVVTDGGETCIFTTQTPSSKMQDLRARGIHIETVPAHAKGHVDLKTVFTLLAEKEINTVLVEAGKTLSSALLQENWVDEWLVFIAAKLLGKGALQAFEWPPLSAIAHAPQWQLTDVKMFDNDVLLTLTR